MSFLQNTLRTGRIQESMASRMILLENQNAKNVDNILIYSPDDQGVIRNLGRSGARFAPEALLSQLKKMAHHDSLKTLFIKNIIDQNLTFDSMQLKSMEQISFALNFKPQKLIHVGGGHDHVYPLLKSLSDHFAKVHILNVDAHLDTRQDKHAHSGTPFRQFMNEAQCDFQILQTGIHHFANSKSTQDKLHSNMIVQTYNELVTETKNFSMPSTIIENFIKEPCDFFVLSLDADAIEGSLMEAVSAVNGLGIPLNFVHQIVQKVAALKSPTAFGVYEYNPLYDNLSCKGAKALTSLMYQYLS